MLYPLSLQLSEEREKGQRMVKAVSSRQPSVSSRVKPRSNKGREGDMATRAPHSAAPLPLSATKERIFQVAEELFAQKGFEGTRTRDIAEQAGINISTLHFHWKSKEDLYAAVYQNLLAQRARLAEEVFAVLTQPPTDLWRETVQAVVDKMFHFFQAHPYAARLDSYRILEATAPSVALQQGQSLLISVAERLRTKLPAELARKLDIEMTILTINSLLRDYFTNPTIFGRILGERNKDALDNRVKRHLQQSVARLFDLL
jgi:AcrR family transcriptional regulator